MGKLFLLRHAKAGWAAPGMRDYDRPLDTIGIRDAAALGIAMAKDRLVPEITLCSGARRCRETLEQVAAYADTGRIAFLDLLYSEDAATYLALIRDHGRHRSALVIGHNPMMEDLAQALAGNGEPAAFAALGLGFPTCGLAVLRVDAGLAKAAPGAAYLETFLLPAEL